jgi:hypothetical protein
MLGRGLGGVFEQAVVHYRLNEGLRERAQVLNLVLGVDSGEDPGD